MPIIQLENGEKLQFDDNYSDEQIGQAVDEYMAGSVKPIEEMPKSEPKPSKFENRARGLGLVTRAGLQAAATPVTLLGDLTTLAANHFGKTNTKLPSQVVSEGLTQIGLPEPKTTKERIASDILEGATGSGLVSKAVKNVATKTPAMIQKFSSRIPTIDAAIGGGAAAGSSLARESGTDPLTQIGFGIGGGLLARKIASPKATQVTSDQIKDLSRQLYKEADEKGGVMNPEFTNKFLTIGENAKPKPIAGSVITKEDKKFIDSIDDFKPLEGKNLTLEDAERIDQALGDKIDSLLEGGGKIGNNARKMIKVQKEFRDSLDELKDSEIVGGKEGLEAAKQARYLWSRAAKLRDIEKVITRANLTDNPSTSLKTGFRNIFINDPKMRGFTGDEKVLIKKAAETGILTDLLRTPFASRLLPIAELASGGLGAAAAAQAAGIAARGGATALQIGKANKLANAIANKALPQKQQPQNFPTIALAIGSRPKQNKK